MKIQIKNRFTGADLWDADLRGANLQDADLCDADLLGADLQGANLQGTKIKIEQKEEIIKCLGIKVGNK